jgi:biopolymer transport protein ExbD
MAFGTQDDTDEVMNEINMTPLVDVMLVLLIIFIITVPVMKHAVNIDLPRATNQPQDAKPETVRLSVTPTAATTGTTNQVDGRRAAGPAAAEAAKNPSPTCTSAATRPCATSAWPRPWPRPSSAGLRKIGFITDSST